MSKRFLKQDFVKKQCRGAVTVEYAVIFPIVIVCIFIIIHIGMLYYQHCLMQTVASKCVRSMALLWGYDPDEINIETGITDRNAYVSEALYWQLITDKNKRGEKAAQAVLNELMSKSVIKPSGGFDVEMTYNNYIIFKKIGLCIRADYVLPFGDLLELVGLPGRTRMEVYSETMVHDTQDFIQNTDYLLQIYEESGARNWVEEKVEPLLNSLKNIKKYFKLQENGQ
ncbi:TadE-like protein [Thermoclostridium stercorarium subsp. stercorarium DSM 8532]|jgi:hypothetical protein|uniref:TadE-like protein n=2 Tax=Thermoclostridium stercorarium TaxID=1510 RepID=L7VNR9_THES1|nr:TadE/TadG family type IV pilus assembly protein [Thermoclostridium stercorarium]AGC68427.1 TadE-like protein [Thermoclostridium stercorarium subsp. stercorarium DSM 8532]AGI39447.1 pilus protein [Thermoclostridium stercorarium subsp. stercorarium DSM 8532]ANW98799.1 pilus assembly protein TadE [Thermoclostridium stercorarium subsp. thermolacticum DSM 2910]UZQ84426.1 pilus assembly protein [Thermoclostridium stercorarium]